MQKNTVKMGARGRPTLLNYDSLTYRTEKSRDRNLTLNPNDWLKV